MSRQRTYGRGSVYKYKTPKGNRYRWQLLTPLDAENPEGEKVRSSKSGFLSRTEAEDSLQIAMSRVKKKKPAISSKAPLRQVADSWLENLDLANSTVYGYRKIVRNHINPHLGSIAIGSLRPTEVARFYRRLKLDGRRDDKDFGGALSANTVSKVHIVLGALLEDAVHQGLIPDNPARAKATVKPPTKRQILEDRQEVSVWSAEELRSFLSWNQTIHGDTLYPLWVVISMTGMRRGEAIALRWSDIDSKKLTISVRRSADSVVSRAVKSTKTYLTRVVDIDSVTMEVLNKHKENRLKLGLRFIDPDSYVFGTLGDELRTPNDVTARWTRIVSLAQAALVNLPPVTLRGLRHTHATLLLQAGENPKVVQERLGHSDIRTTLNIYSHVTPTIQREAVKRFASWLQGEEEN
jgi:integrase